MPPLTSLATDRHASERHTRILDAAERVFARAGFHLATMNDVAVEAGMSPGNLYRYFPSKDAIIAAMAERDRSTIAADFSLLDPARGSVLDQIEALGRRRMAEEPRAKAILALQIMAEASRSDTMAELCHAIDGSVLGGLTDAIAGAKRSGELPQNLDDSRFLAAILMMADGFFCRRAIDPNYDAAEAAETIFAVMRVLAKHLTKTASDHDPRTDLEA